MAEVATTKLFENDRVIVWEMVLEPGESTGVHTHQHDYFFHVLEGSTVGTRDKDGVPLGEFDLDAGSTNWLALDGDELMFGDVRLPATHDAENVGSGRYREILVELK